MPSYRPDFKEVTVRKMMPPYNQSVAHLSRETGVSEATLYGWKKKFQSRGFVVPAKPSRPDRWDALAAVIQTATTNEVERSTYCRERGLCPEQLKAWKEQREASRFDSDMVPAMFRLRFVTRASHGVKKLKRFVGISK